MDQGPACADRENSSPAGCAAAAPGGRFLSYLIDDGASLLPDTPRPPGRVSKHWVKVTAMERVME
jgi:hypothetical protein